MSKEFKMKKIAPAVWDGVNMGTRPAQYKLTVNEGIDGWQGVAYINGMKWGSDKTEWVASFIPISLRLRAYNLRELRAKCETEYLKRFPLASQGSRSPRHSERDG